MAFFAAAARRAEQFLFSASRRTRTSYRLIPHPGPEVYFRALALPKASVTADFQAASFHTKQK
jgi:hypothetical protein